MAAAIASGASAQNALVQEGYSLTQEYVTPVLSNSNNARGGVAINDKFFVNFYGSDQVQVFDKTGAKVATIAAPKVGDRQFHLWLSANVDAAGHVLAQLDVNAWAGIGGAGNVTPAAGDVYNHGMMVIDSKTNEILQPFVGFGGGSAVRYDAMAPVLKDVMTEYNAHVISVLSGGANAYQQSFNENAGTEASFWKVAAFAQTAGSNLMPSSSTATSTGYAMEYMSVNPAQYFEDGSPKPEMAMYFNPLYTQTYSAAGKYGNAIQNYVGNWTATGKYFYTPMHSGLTAFNIFTIAGKQYIIYPAQNPGNAAGDDNRPADAFAISEVSFVDSPVTDMTMEGETLVDGLPVGKLIAVFPGSSAEGIASCVPSYTIQPVEGDENSVYIYVFNSGAPGYKWKFTVAEEEEPEQPQEPAPVIPEDAYVVYNNGTIAEGLGVEYWWNAAANFNAANPTDENGLAFEFNPNDHTTDGSMGLLTRSSAVTGPLHNATLNFSYYAEGTGDYTVRLTCLTDPASEYNYNFTVNEENAGKWTNASFSIAEQFPALATQWNDAVAEGGYVFSIVVAKASSDAAIYFRSIFYTGVDAEWKAPSTEEPDPEEPGDAVTFEGTATGTYTQTMDEVATDYNYTLNYAISYNENKTLTIKGEYVWENDPVGATDGITYQIPGVWVYDGKANDKYTTKTTYEEGTELEIYFKTGVALGVVEAKVPYTVGSTNEGGDEPDPDEPDQPEKPEPVAGTYLQEGYSLTQEYVLPATISTTGNARSGIGINDNFYVNLYASDKVVAYDKTGAVVKEFAAPKVGDRQWHNWISSNVDGAGHLLVQLDINAWAGIGGAGKVTAAVVPDPETGVITEFNHGFMVIDTKTNEILQPFVGMGGSAYRYDAMAPVLKDITKDYNTRILNVLQGLGRTYQQSYNQNQEGVSEATFWKVVGFDSNVGNADMGVETQTSTGYALEYPTLDGTSSMVAMYSNPEMSTTYSANGKYGNGIRDYNTPGNWKATPNYFYTPMHSCLTGFNIFTLAGKQYIIYPAQNPTVAAGENNRPADAFAIAEVTYISSAATNLTMEGETLVNDAVVGPMKALFIGSEGVEAGATSCVPSYTVQPVEGDENSVYIYVFNSGAPACKWKFTAPEYVAPQELAIVGEPEVVKGENNAATAVITVNYTATSGLVGEEMTVTVNNVVEEETVEVEATGKVSISVALQEGTNTFNITLSVGELEATTTAVIGYTGIDGITIESDVEYFNLQGIRVNNPENGVFIMKKGNTVTKVVR